MRMRSLRFSALFSLISTNLSKTVWKACGGIRTVFVLLGCALALLNWIVPSRAFASNPPYAFVYTSTDSGGQFTPSINGFSIDGTSGALSAVSSSPFSAGGNVLRMVGHPLGSFMYAAVVSGSATDVEAFTVDSVSGGLTPVAGSPNAAGSAIGGDPPSSFFAMAPNGKFLYLANGKVFGFTINTTTGALTSISPTSATGYSVLAISPGGDYLYAGNGSNAVVVYSINSSSGVLTQVQSITGCGGQDMAIDSTGSYLYGLTAGITACQINPSTGELSTVSGSPFFSTQGFTGLAIHPSGPYLYTVATGSVTTNPAHYVYGYSINGTSGALTPMQNSPFAIPSEGGNYSYTFNIAVEPRGKYAYTTEANYGVGSYSVNATNGELSLLSNSFTGPAAETLAVLGTSSSSNPTLVSLSLSPASADLVTSTLGKTVQFTLSGTYSDSSTRFLTDSATWSSSDTSVATVANGLATAKEYGGTTITAGYGGLSAQAQMTVESPPLVSIAVTPATVTIPAGSSIAFRATGTYGDASKVDLTNKVTWESLTTSVATIDATGLALGKATGSSTISATDDAVTGSATLTVGPSVTPLNQFGHFVYTSTDSGGRFEPSINGYSIDGTSGVLSAVPLSPFSAGAGVVGIVGHPSGNFLYAAIAGNSASQVAAFTVDSVTGGLTPVAGSPYAAGSVLGGDPPPSFFAMAPNGKFLYLANGKVLGFSINTTTGALTSISPTSATGYSVLAISPGGNYLYAGNGSDVVVVYSINSSSGVLTQVQSMTGCGGQNMAIDSSGRYLYGLGNGITACKIDATTGDLSTVSGSPFLSGQGFRGIAAHPSGPYLYTVNTGSVTTNPARYVYGYTIDGSSGALIPMQHSPFPLPSEGGNYSYTFNIAVEPRGKYVYTTEANYGVGSYSVNATNGELSLLSTSFTGPATEFISILASNQPWSPDVTWTTPSSITYGTALGSTELDATAGVPGTFAYTPPAGTILNAGSRTLSVNFTPTDSAEFASQSASVNLTVNKATPQIAWPAPAAIPYGVPLGSSQLDATASVPGTFSYSPTAGTVLTAGQHTLSVTFTPSDTTDYTQATAQVTITVNKVGPTLTWGTPSSIAYGTPLGSTQLDATANVPGTFSFSPSAGTILSAGQHTLSVTFTPSDATDYTTATASVTLNVNKATPTVSTWPAASAIAFGQTLASSTLTGGTASVPGAFAWSVPSIVP